MHFQTSKASLENSVDPDQLASVAQQIHINNGIAAENQKFIIGMNFIFVDFIHVYTPANHSQTK